MFHLCSYLFLFCFYLKEAEIQLEWLRQKKDLLEGFWILP